MKKLFYLSLGILVSVSFQHQLFGQTPDSTILKQMEYRFLGPFRGGRSTAVAGIPDQPHVFFMGATGGGVWRSDDAGQTWDNVSDGQILCGSIGSIAIHPKYPDVIYVGTGSDSPRGNISPGIGIYKSEDGGKSWTHKGLSKCGQIGDVLFHPDNPDIAYVAALGNIFGPNRERGVYKTQDGGTSWEQVMYLNDTTGAIDIAIHPNNPNILYAGMWRVERKPWTLIDGGQVGGLFKSTDAGKSWDQVHNGLPKGLLGKIGISISPADPNIIYVLQQTAKEQDGGIYKSIDGGTTFKRINGDHKLRQRGWYYSRIFADPADKHTVYVTNTGFYRSIDGGNTFDQRLRVPHGDCHDVWINPNNPEIIINSNDGGATVTLNGGRTWSTPYNQPTAEFYRISTDNSFPMRVYAGQQDNSTISVPLRNRGGLDPKQHWLEVGGGESADIAVVPSNPDIVYATTYSGIITHVNLKTGEERQVGAYPHYTEGTEQRKLKYRWQWNFPIRVSQHNENVIYHTSNFVHKSTDEGHSWQLISEDLTRNIDAYQDIPGGPIQHDATGVEVYSSLFALTESPFDANELWVGSDDGLLHMTLDGGKNWKNVTPKELPKEATINHIELSPHDRNTLFLVAYNYRYADFSPYLYKTTDQGKSWKLITTGIAKDHFTRSLVQDPVNPMLLFTGTEFGMYASMDGGEHWFPFQQNLPHTPITDMEIKDATLVMSTQGRGFWSLDDLSILREWTKATEQNTFHLYKVSDTYKSNLGSGRGKLSPPSAYYNVNYNLWTQDTLNDVSLSILNSQGEIIFDREDKVNMGLNKGEWNMQIKAPFMVKDLVMMDMSHPGRGPSVPPGDYQLKISQGETSSIQDFKILLDPNWEASNPDYQAQFELAKKVSNLLAESQRAIQHLRSLNMEIEKIIGQGVSQELEDKLKSAGKKSKGLQDMIFQDKIKTSQDEINFERLFTNHLIRLYRVILSQHGKPSAGELERWTDVQEEYLPFKERYTQFINEEVESLNFELKEMDMGFLSKQGKGVSKKSSRP